VCDALPRAVTRQAPLVTSLHQAPGNERACHQCLVFINTQETPWIPPFGREQAFDDDTIKEILLFVTPPEWQRKMDRMGFDPTHHDSLGLLHFMENVEAAEPPIPAATGMRDLLARLNVRA
jgi:hypothetical protein